MFCHNCGTSLPGQSAFCPGCGVRTNAAAAPSQAADKTSKTGEKTRKREWRQGFVALVFGMGVMVALIAFIGSKEQAPTQAGPLPGNAANSSAAPRQQDLAAPSPASMASVPALRIPVEEQQFINAMQSGRTAFQQAPNEMAQGGTRSRRRVEICRTLSGLSVSDWVGQITTLGSNSDGKGVLEISLADGVRIKTWNNDLSDISDDTLIAPSSSLFQALSQMKEGSSVTFSGTFLPSDLDCVKESSVTLRGSMGDPEFIFRFAKVEKY